MDGFKVFRFHGIGVNSFISIQSGGNVANHILDKFWIVVGSFGNEFFIRAFEQSI